MPRENRPEILPSSVREIRTPDGKMWLTVVEERDEPIEIHISIGKNGGSIAAWTNCVCNLVNTLLEYGVPLTRIIEEISGITSDKFSRYASGVTIRSGPEGISHGLYLHMTEKR